MKLLLSSLALLLLTGCSHENTIDLSQYSVDTVFCDEVEDTIQNFKGITICKIDDRYYSVPCNQMDKFYDGNITNAILCTDRNIIFITK